MELYENCLASGVYYYTEAGTMKPASRHSIGIWILESWAQLDKALIIGSFKPCALNLKNVGGEDNIIHCFKSGKPCLKGGFFLKDQVNILNNDKNLTAIHLK